MVYLIWSANQFLLRAFTVKKQVLYWVQGCSSKPRSLLSSRKLARNRRLQPKRDKKVKVEVVTGDHIGRLNRYWNQERLESLRGWPPDSYIRARDTQPRGGESGVEKCGWPRTGSSMCSRMQVNESGTFQELLTKVLQHSWNREWRVGATRSETGAKQDMESLRTWPTSLDLYPSPSGL